MNLAWQIAVINNEKNIKGIPKNESACETLPLATARRRLVTSLVLYDCT